MSRADHSEPAREAAAGPSKPAVERLSFRLKDLETAVGVDERTIQRWRAKGQFPKPDLTIGKTPLWRVETIRDWLARGGSR